jgi:hypothetical protein
MPRVLTECFLILGFWSTGIETGFGSTGTGGTPPIFLPGRLSIGASSASPLEFLQGVKDSPCFTGVTNATTVSMDCGNDVHSPLKPPVSVVHSKQLDLPRLIPPLALVQRFTEFGPVEDDLLVETEDNVTVIPSSEVEPRQVETISGIQTVKEVTQHEHEVQTVTEVAQHEQQPSGTNRSILSRCHHYLKCFMIFM